MKRKSFSLVELIVAMTLIAVVFAGFSTLFFHFARYESSLEAKTKKFSDLRMNAASLQRILSRAIFGQDSKYCFYTEESQSKQEKGTSLVFTFHRGVDHEPDFSNVNIARLFLNNEGALILASWPDPKRFKVEPRPMRKEVIFTDVSSLAMRFYSFKEPAKHITTNNPQPNVWLDSWEKAYKAQPQLVEISLTFNNNEPGMPKDMVFSCVIPRSFPIIEY